jgi:hypothetical protein
MAYFAKFDADLEYKLATRLKKDLAAYLYQKFVIHTGELRVPNGDGSCFVGNFRLYKKFIICATDLVEPKYIVLGIRWKRFETFEKVSTTGAAVVGFTIHC